MFVLAEGFLLVVTSSLVLNIRTDKSGMSSMLFFSTCYYLSWCIIVFVPATGAVHSWSSGFFIVLSSTSFLFLWCICSYGDTLSTTLSPIGNLPSSGVFCCYYSFFLVSNHFLDLTFFPFFLVFDILVFFCSDWFFLISFFFVLLYLCSFNFVPVFNIFVLFFSCHSYYA